VLRLLVTVNFVPSSPNLVTLIMEAILSSEMPALTRGTRRHLSEDGILHIIHLRPIDDLPFNNILHAWGIFLGGGS
jgi:hypothetical protein